MGLSSAGVSARPGRGSKGGLGGPPVVSASPGVRRGGGEENNVSRCLRR